MTKALARLKLPAGTPAPMAVKHWCKVTKRSKPVAYRVSNGELHIRDIASWEQDKSPIEDPGGFLWRVVKP